LRRAAQEKELVKREYEERLRRTTEEAEEKVRKLLEEYNKVQRDKDEVQREY
jgi:archaellum component FlaC